MLGVSGLALAVAACAQLRFKAAAIMSIAPNASIHPIGQRKTAARRRAVFERQGLSETERSMDFLEIRAAAAFFDTAKYRRRYAGPMSSITRSQKGVLLPLDADCVADVPVPQLVFRDSAFSRALRRASADNLTDSACLSICTYLAAAALVQ